MPAPHPPEFRQRAVELARMREKPVSEIAQDRDYTATIQRPGHDAQWPSRPSRANQSTTCQPVPGERFELSRSVSSRGV